LLRLSDEQKQGAIDTFFVTVKEELDITPAKVQVLQYQQEKAVFLDEQGYTDAGRSRSSPASLRNGKLIT
jgi:hypothetical protein